MSGINSEVLEFIDRLAEIDRTRPAHDPEKVIASFKKRLAATGLTREVRWVTDPSGLIAADGNEIGDQVAWPVWGAYETALACREKTAASDLRLNLWKMKAWNAYNSVDAATYDAWLWAWGYVISARRIMSEVEEALQYLDVIDRDANLSHLVNVYEPMLSAAEGGAFAYCFREQEIAVLASPAIWTAQGNLHRVDGPALKWPITKLFYCRGVRVPDWYILQKEKITGQAIESEIDPQLRHAMCEIIGRDKAADELGAYVVAADELKGQRRELLKSDALGQKFVRVPGGIVEPDGRRRDFVAPVSRLATTPREAIALLAAFHEFQDELNPILQDELSPEEIHGLRLNFFRPECRPEAQEIIDRLASIDWTSPPQDPERVVAAFKKRAAVSGYTGNIRWVSDPSDLDLDYTNILTDRAARLAWDVRSSIALKDGHASGAYDIPAAWAFKFAFGKLNFGGNPCLVWDDAEAAIRYLNIEDKDRAVRRLVDVYEPMLSAFEGGAFAYFLCGHEIAVLASPAIWTAKGVVQVLHRADGPALDWPKLKLFYWHNTSVPDWYILQKEKITGRAIIDEPHAELRHAMCEIIGWKRAVDILGATVIASDELNGRQTELLESAASHQKFVRMVPGADGSREVVIPVPYSATTPQEGIAMAAEMGC